MSNWFSVAIYLLTALLAGWYAQRLLPIKLRRVPTIIIWSVIYFSSQVLRSAVTGLSHPAEVFFRFAAGLLVFLILSALLCRGERTMKVFAALSFMAGSEIVRFISSALNAVLNNIVFRTVFMESEYASMSAAKEAALRMTAWTNVLLAVSILIQFVILGAYLYIISKQFHTRVQRLRPHEKLFLVLPSVAVLCIAVTLQLLVISVESGMSIIVYDTVPATQFWVPLICLLLLSVVISSVVLFQKMLKHNEEEKRRLFLEKQMEEMRSEVEEIQNIYSDIRGMQHDMRGHLANVHAIIGSGGDHLNELSAYLEKMDQTLDRLDFPVKTGSLITDIIISRKRKEAEEKGVPLNMDFLFPANLQIDAYDIGIVLENALSNALEACETTGGKVSLRSYVKGSLFFLETENACTGEIRWDGSTGLPLSSKEDADAHGIGLASIRRCARKYKGDIDIRIGERNGEQVFQLTVMMNGSGADGLFDEI